MLNDDIYSVLENPTVPEQCQREFDMEPDLKKEIEEIIGQMQCPKDFQCYKSGFKDLCKAKAIGLRSFLQCLEENPQNCLFLLAIADSHYCDCPLRMYIARKLRK